MGRPILWGLCSFVVVAWWSAAPARGQAAEQPGGDQIAAPSQTELPPPAPPPVSRAQPPAPTTTAGPGVVTTPESALDADRRPKPVEGRYALEETPLVIAESSVRSPANWTGDVRPLEPLPVFRRVFARHHRFAEPFLLTGVLPDVETRLVTVPGVRSGRAEIDQYALFSAWAVEVYGPLFTLRGAEPVRPEHFRFNIKVPVGIGQHHRVAVQFSGDLPTTGEFATKTGGHVSLGWAYGSELLAAQARVGVGNDRLLGEFDAPFRSTLLFDGLVSMRFGRHLRGIVQADGREDLEGEGGAVRLWPGVRVYPFGDARLSIGAAGLWWLARGDEDGDWDTRRAGGLVDIGWVFL